MADDHEDSHSATGKASPRTIAGGIIAVLAVLFIVSNSESAEVSFLGIGVTMPLWIVLTVTFAVGLVVGTLVLGRSRYKPSKRSK